MDGLCRSNCGLATGMLHLADEFPEMGVLAPPSIGGTPVVLALDVADAEGVFAQAVTAGAQIRQPLADMFWGDRHGQLEDPFGHRWNIAQPIRDVPHDEVCGPHSLLTQVPRRGVNVCEEVSDLSLVIVVAVLEWARHTEPVASVGSGQPVVVVLVAGTVPGTEAHTESLATYGDELLAPGIPGVRWRQARTRRVETGIEAWAGFQFAGSRELDVATSIEVWS